MKTFLLAFAFSIFHFTNLNAQTWSIDVDYAESCECDAPCPCLLGGDPTHRHCMGNSIIMVKRDTMIQLMSTV